VKKNKFLREINGPDARHWFLIEQMRRAGELHVKRYAVGITPIGVRERDRELQINAN
jgi:hypothetical protein